MVVSSLQQFAKKVGEFLDRSFNITKGLVSLSRALNRLTEAFSAIPDWVLKLAAFSAVLLTVVGPLALFVSGLASLTSLMGGPLVKMALAVLSLGGFKIGAGFTIASLATKGFFFALTRIALVGTVVYLVLEDIVGWMLGWEKTMTGMIIGDTFSAYLEGWADTLHMMVDDIKSVINWLGKLKDKLGIKTGERLGVGKDRFGIGVATEEEKAALYRERAIAGVTQGAFLSTLSPVALARASNIERGNIPDMPKIYPGSHFKTNPAINVTVNMNNGTSVEKADVRKIFAETARQFSNQLTAYP